MNCKDCKWSEPSDEVSDLLSCNDPKMESGYGFEAGEVPPDGWLVEDDEVWGIAVGPMFGCKHFEAKDIET